MKTAKSSGISSGRLKLINLAVESTVREIRRAQVLHRLKLINLAEEST